MKGGLIGLAAATVGLTSEAAQHLEVRNCSLVSSFFVLLSEFVCLFIMAYNLNSFHSTNYAELILLVHKVISGQWV